jgi:hypothetical protein
MHVTLHRAEAVCYFLVVPLCFLSAACHVILPLASRPENGYRCQATAYVCGTRFKNPVIRQFNWKGEFKPTHKPPSLPDCYYLWPPATAPGSQDGLRAGTEKQEKVAFCDRNWKIRDVSWERLRGASWFFTPQDAKYNDLLRFEVVSNVANVYVAVDPRMLKGKQSAAMWWLISPNNQFEPVEPKQHVSIFREDTASGAKHVDLEIWKYTASTLKPGVKWDVLFASCMMIFFPERVTPMVILEPTRDLDPSIVKDEHEFVIDACVKTKAEAEQVFKDAVIDYYEAKGYPPEAVQFGKIEYTSLSDCLNSDALRTVERTLKIDVSPSLVRRSCVVEFDKNFSYAEFGIFGQGIDESHKSKVTKGTMDFTYLVDPAGGMVQVKVTKMVLEFAEVAVESSEITDIVGSLLIPAVADASPGQTTAKGKPFDVYQIPVNKFVAKIAGKIGSDKIVTAGVNQQPIQIQIDQVNKGFQFKGGPVKGKMGSGQEELELSISIDLTGKFVSFEPFVSTAESTLYVECMEGRNKLPVYLHSTQSVDIYDKLPTQPDKYKWFEDYGAATERLWAQGANSTIAPYKLGCGVHHFTLTVEDNEGIIGRDSLPVEVIDSQAPVFSRFPQDVVAMVFDKRPVKLSIGSAEAYDGCALDVMVQHDAPLGMLFPAGEITTVTWRADDGHGNVKRKKQQVTVLSSIGFGWEDSLTAFEQLKSSYQKDRLALAKCTSGSDCFVGLGAFVHVSEQLADQVTRMSLPKENEELRQTILAELTPATAAVAAAHDLLERYRFNAPDDDELRTAALTQLDVALEHMNELTNLAWPAPPADGRSLFLLWIFVSAFALILATCFVLRRTRAFARG